MDEIVYGSEGKWNTATSEICRVERKTSDMVAHANHHAGTGKLDGMSNKIKVAERIAYGYGDDDYFFTLIRYQSSRSPNNSVMSQKK